VIEHAMSAAPLDEPYRAWVGAVRDLLVEARRRGELLRGVSVDDAAGFLVSSLAGIEMTSDVQSARKDLADRFVDLWSYVLPGLASAPEELHWRPSRRPARVVGRQRSA